METKKYVRIKKASVDGVWYADKIGQIFEVERLNSVSVLTNRGVHGESSVLVEDVDFIFTENRRPKVDEHVLITYGITSSGDYKTGDICTVRSVVDIYGTITVKEHGNCVIAREYEVIVNNEIKNEEADGMGIDLNGMGYEELLAHGDAVMEAIKKRTFQEGFRAAKQVQRKLAKMNAEKSAQACRDEIVEQAKADIQNLKYRTFYGELRYLYRSIVCNVEFVINKKKSTVVALLKSVGRGTVKSKGIAKAAPSDCFNVHIGKAIALRRALGLAVPDEYLNAPQPTEVRVGDVIRSAVDKSKEYVIAKGEKAWCDGMAGLSSMAAKYGRIIDDSREEVGGE